MTRFYRAGWYFCRGLFLVLFGFKPVGGENVPATGPAIVAANHRSYFDPPMVGASVYREFHFFAKRELFSVPLLGKLITNLNAIPVRRGVYDPASLGRVKAVLRDGGVVLMFPEGTRSDSEDFLPAKPGIGMIAKQARVPIVPAYLYRSNRLWRAVFLRRHVRVFYGAPITPEEQDRFPDTKEGYRGLASYVMEHIERLRVVSEG